MYCQGLRLDSYWTFLSGESELDVHTNRGQNGQRLVGSRYPIAIIPFVTRDVGSSVDILDIDICLQLYALETPAFVDAQVERVECG